MGQPVVHFEVAGKDIQKQHGFYSGLFGWEFDTSNPKGYGILAREDTLSAAASARLPKAMTGTSRSTSPCPTSRPRCSRSRASAARA